LIHQQYLFIIPQRRLFVLVFLELLAPGGRFVTQTVERGASCVSCFKLTLVRIV